MKLNYNNMENISFFDMFDEIDIKEVNKVNEVINKKETQTRESKNSKINTKTKTSKKVQAVDPIKKIEEECSKCEKIIVKVFGHPAFTIEDKDEIKEIKVKNILKRVIESGFDEFTTIKADWKLSLSEDNKIGYLIPTYANFYAKG